MTDSPKPPLTEIAFTPAVKAMQERLGSRPLMERLEASGRWKNHLTPELAGFIESRRSVYFGTASRDGQPYIQHRGGPPGFLQILDARTLMFFDYPGNKQYISLGNLAENPKAFLFMMDYPTKTRIKFWGRAGVDFGQDGTRRILFHIEAWDINCRKHIPNLVPADTTSPE